MTENKVIMLYIENRKYIDMLTDEQKGRFITALLDYAENGISPDLGDDAAVNMVYTMFKDILDRQINHYDDICRRRSEAGKKGAAAKKAKSTKSAIAVFAETDTAENTANQAIYNVNDNVNVNDNSIEDTDVSLSPPQGDPAAGEHISVGEIDRPVNDTAVKPQQVVDMYNSICVSFPKVTVLSDKRRKAVNARLRSMGHSLEKFRLLFEKAERSDFLKGANKRDWRANFDWLMKDANMAKVLDGNYDNSPPSGTGTYTRSPHECPSDEDYRVSIIDLL